MPYAGVAVHSCCTSVLPLTLECQAARWSGQRCFLPDLAQADRSAMSCRLGPRRLVTERSDALGPA